MADALSRKNPAPRLNAGDRDDQSKALLSSSTASRAEQIETLRSNSREEARFMREYVHETAAEAVNYLGTIMDLIAGNDVPGLRYLYAQFLAYGRIAAIGCKELFCNGAGGAR